MPVRIGVVVEGHGEVESVPALIRRIAQDFDSTLQIVVPHPIRVPKSKLLKLGELERAVQLAALNAGSSGGILVLLDSDGDCPAELGPQLLERVRSARSDLPSAVVVANNEFESWFLASAASLPLATAVELPDRPEEIRGAKEWLRRHLSNGVYSETVDQVKLTHGIDLTTARRASSFDKCYRDVLRLLQALRQGAQ